MKYKWKEIRSVVVISSNLIKASEKIFQCLLLNLKSTGRRNYLITRLLRNR